MATAKDIILKPIPAKQSNELVRRVHYSGKVVQNSQLHIGVFLNGKLEGAMQLGPSLDKRKIMGLVSGTGWNEFIELNRMAFTDALPRNSESRAIGIAIKLLRQHAPHLKWVISFADACQCGDGTIYRASGFVLTGVKKNNQVWVKKDSGEILSRVTATKSKHAITGGASMKPYEDAGFKPISGYQLRYIYFIDPTYRQRLTVPELPFSRIAEMGAKMYKGHASEVGNHPDQGQGGGSTPTRTLHYSENQPNKP